MISTVQAVLNALELPKGSRVDQRIPKKLLLVHGAPTAVDKRLISEAIEEIQWIAALKPNNIGVPSYRDTLREYLEIAVLAATLRGNVKPASRKRLADLVHRVVPYPVLLLLIEGRAVTLSLVHKRWAQNEADKLVLDDSPASASLTDTMSEPEVPFIESLPVSRQPQETLYTLYQGWMDCVRSLQAARLTGRYQSAENPGQAEARRQALTDCERLEAEISGLRVQAAKEKQMARRVELNLKQKRLQTALAAARQKL